MYIGLRHRKDLPLDLMVSFDRDRKRNREIGFALQNTDRVLLYGFFNLKR